MPTSLNETRGGKRTYTNTDKYDTSSKNESSNKLTHFSSQVKLFSSIINILTKNRSNWTFDKNYENISHFKQIFTDN